MLNYTYPSLSPSQVTLRRQALDSAGLQSYLFPIVLLSTLWIYKHYFSTPPPPSSQTAHAPTILQAWSRRLKWLLFTTPLADFGTLDVVVLTLLYTFYLMVLIFKGTGNDYMHLTKALSHVTVAQIPLHYLFSLKSLSNPLTVATGLTHERLNNFHRLFGRILHTLLAAHAIMYLYFFIDLSILSKRIKDRDVRTGIIAFWTLNFLGLLSLPPVRTKLYHKLFYRSHVFLSAFLLVVVALHVPYTRIYIAQAGIAWVLNGVLRRNASRKVEVKTESVGQDLIRVKIKTPRQQMEQTWPGMHVYLNHPSPAAVGPRTPFTIFEVKDTLDSKDDVEVTLVAKNSGGPQTGMLAAAAKNGQVITMRLEGPYGEAAVYMPRLTSGGVSGRKILIVAGGVGATYALPVWRALRSKKAGAEQCRLVWVVKNLQETEWAEEFIRDAAQEGGKLDVEIYVTKSTNKTTSLEDLKGQVRVNTGEGRPDFVRVTADFFAEDDMYAQGQVMGLDRVENRKWSFTPVSVFCCGPVGMKEALRKSVGMHVWGYGREVEWWEEGFGFGGS